MDQLIERVAKAPIGAKVAAVAGTVLLATVLNYFVISPTFGPSISEVNERIVRADKELVKLDREFTEKTAIANNLNQFRREKELLEQQLREALAELPEEKKVDELLLLFQDRAQKSGLEIATIEPKSPVNEKFYARLPIPMAVSGNFHEIATFFDALGRMRRIVNVTDIVLDTPKDVNGKMVLNAKFLATAFMFIDPSTAPAAKPAGAKR
jgi:type IV pilus assembly protein PilO